MPPKRKPGERHRLQTRKDDRESLRISPPLSAGNRRVEDPESGRALGVFETASQPFASRNLRERSALHTCGVRFVIPSDVSTFPAQDFESCLIISSRELHMVAPYMLPDLIRDRAHQVSSHCDRQNTDNLTSCQIDYSPSLECLGPGDHCCGGPGDGYRSVGRVLLARAAGRGH